MIAPIMGVQPHDRRARTRGQLHRVTWIDGLKRPTVTPAPRSIAWVARGVVTNRASSDAADGAWLPASVRMLHCPCACNDPAVTRFRSPLARSWDTANDSAGASPLPRL